MSNMCLIVTPAVEELANKIQQSYPEACKRIGFNNQMCAEWIGLYNNDNSKDPDNIPEEKSLVNYIEKLRNKEGKSFLRDLDAEKKNGAAQEDAAINKSEQRLYNEGVISSELDKSIQSGEWNNDTINEFNNLIDNIENGTVHFNRFLQGADEAWKGSSRVTKAAGLLTRGDGRANEKEPSSLSSAERYERDKRDQVEQEKKLVAWAKAAGVWAENPSDVTKGMKHLVDMDGGEAQIYVKDNKTIRKLINTGYFVTPQFMVDRIVLHNMLSPNAVLTLAGFTEDTDGNLLFVVDQPFIEGTTPTKEEIADFLSSDFNKWDKNTGNTYISKDGSIYLSDMHDENIIKAPNGAMIIIDLDARLNTPDLNHNGSYVIDDSLTSLLPSQAAQTEGFENGSVSELLDKQTEATTPQQIQKELSRPETTSLQSELKAPTSQQKAFYNAFSPAQITARAKMISGMFSNIVDDTVLDRREYFNDVINSNTASEEDKEAARRSLDVYEDPILARAAAVDFLTYSVIMDRIKADLATQAEYATDDVRRQKLENTVTFFDQLAQEAARWIDEEEGVRKGMNESSDEEDTTSGEFEDNEDESSDGNEGFITKERLVNPFTRLSRQVKRVCGGIETGQKDDLGYSRTYSQGFIYSALMSYLSNNMETPDDFIKVIGINDYEEGMEDIEHVRVNSVNYPYGYPQFPTLEKMEGKYPWVNQVIARLVKDYRKPDEDDSTQLRFPSTFGTLASQFYTNFKCAFIPYGKIVVGKDRNGNDYDSVIPLNYDMEERSQLEELRDSFNNGITYSENSIYGTDKVLNQEKAKKLSNRITSYINDIGGMTNLYHAYKDYVKEGYKIDDIYKKKVNDLMDLIKSFGINITEDNVIYLLTDSQDGAKLKSMLSDLGLIADDVVKMDSENISEKNYLTDLKERWKNFFRGRGMVTETKMKQSFYDPASRKTRYSYSSDNYIQRTMRNIFGKNRSKEGRQQYINEHFGKYEWYRDQSAPEGQGWKSLWLEYAYNDDNPRDELPYRSINSVNTKEYRDWNTSDIYRVIMRSWDTGSDDYAFYLGPIFADSPMCMTMRGPKYSYEELISGTYDEQGRYVEPGFVRLVEQELERINYVTGARREAINEGRVLPIANYEKRGAVFCLFPELNDRMFGPDGNLTFNEYLQTIRDSYSASEEKSAGTLSLAITDAISEAIEGVLQSRFNDFYADMPNDVKSELIGGEVTAESDASLIESLRIPYYNMVYADTQIIELTVVDPAFSKNSVDFQKRFKQVYASGKRLNTNSRYGKKFERVILVSDEEITSRSYDSIKNIVSKAREEGRINKSEENYILSCYAFLKDRKQSGINVSDAQAMRSLSSYRSVLDMMGLWTDNLENSFERITNSDWSMEDFDTVFQTLKPFVYSVIEKASGDGSSIPVPVQHKNSELVLLAMYDMINGGLKNSEKLKGINKFLEESKDADGNPIGDMIQFESAGKSGNQGVININYSHKKVMDAVKNGSIQIVGNNNIIDTEVFLDSKKFAKNTRENSADNFDEIKTQLTRQLIEGKIQQDTFNNIMSYFQPTAEEVQKTLEDYATVKSDNGDIVEINPEAVQEIPFDDWMQVQPTPQHHIDATAPQGSQGRNIIVADLPDGFSLTLEGVKGSNSTFDKDKLVDFYYNLIVENLIQNYGELGNIFKDNRSLRDTVMNLAMSNPTYGRDFAEAFSLDSNGNFILSPNSPTIFRKVQQLVNSVIKKKIAVQKVDGAALIQASGVGLSDELNLVFDDNGKLVGAECYLPATSRRFYETLMKKVRINGKTVDVLDPALLEEAGLDKAIGYRIPTENKSSMLPIIIKGFAPQQNGSSIFLPAEITTLSGSDFDVDKMFVMLSSFSVSEYYMGRARRDFAETDEMFGRILDGLVKAGNLQELEENEIEGIDNDAFRQWFAENRERYRREKPRIIKYEYDFSKSPKENGRKARNTMLVQIMHKILTSQEGSENMFNPQNFEGVVQASKMMKIMQDRDLLQKYMVKTNTTMENVVESLLSASKKSLEDFVKDNDVDRSPVYPQTFTYFHNQNMTGDALLAMFALQVSATAKFQRADIELKPDQQFTINGRKIKDVDKIFNGLGEHRLKNVSQFVGACADNGKDPNLSDFGATRQNAKVIAYLLRAGLSIKEAALIVNQPLMDNPEERYNLAGYKKDWTDIPVTSEELADAILTGESTKAIAILCSKVLEQADALSDLTRISRADSPNGGMPETFAKARAYKHMVDKYNGRQNSREFPFYPIKEAISNTKVNLGGSEEDVRESIISEKMSMLQGFYSLGVQSFDRLLSPYFSLLDEKFDDLVTSPLLVNMPYRMSPTQQEELLTAMYDEYVTFALSGMPLFGDEENTTMKEKRDYYLNQFPKEYPFILAENPDIKEAIGNIIVLDGTRLVHQGSMQLEKGQRDEVMRRITSLLYLDNPNAQKLAKDLFVYSYYDNGLLPSANGFSTLLSTQLVSSVEGYNEALNGITDNLDGDMAENFILQFVNNHPQMAFDADKKIKDTDVTANGTIIINRFKNDNFENPVYSKVYPYRFVRLEGELYLLSSFDNDYIYYKKMTRFGSGQKLYDVNMNLSQMATAYPYSEQTEDTSIDPFTGDVEFGYNVVPVSEETEIGSEMNSDYEGPSTGTATDVYTSKGSQQIRNKMC